ncbi:MAG: hypothetical protein ACJ8MO_18140 [Bacillus sp. (in: firmicutes)]
MRMSLQKKEGENGLINPLEQDHMDQSSLDENSPEFDVIGTALNDI